MMFETPTDVPSVERKDSGKWFCSMCRSTFDREAFEMVDGCPGCEHMARAQENIRGGL